MRVCVYESIFFLMLQALIYIRLYRNAGFVYDKPGLTGTSAQKETRPIKPGFFC